MARQKKPKYEYVEQLGLYRKRVQDATGKYVAVYGQTQEELTEKLSNFNNKSNLSPIGRKNPLVNDYIQEWVELHTVNMTYGGQLDYQSIINLQSSFVSSWKIANLSETVQSLERQLEDQNSFISSCNSSQLNESMIYSELSTLTDIVSSFLYFL